MTSLASRNSFVCDRLNVEPVVDFPNEQMKSAAPQYADSSFPVHPAVSPAGTELLIVIDGKLSAVTDRSFRSTSPE
jgi:hypothetical protein